MLTNTSAAVLGELRHPHKEARHDTPEAARHAASVVTITCDVAPHDAQFRPDHPKAYAPKRVNSFKPADRQRGDVQPGFAQVCFTVDQIYTTPA